MGFCISSEIPINDNRRRYNQPLVPKIVIIVVDKQYMEFSRDIILHQIGGDSRGDLQWIKEIHLAYDALSYSLLFPNGRCGWLPTFKENTGVTLKLFV